MIKYFFAIGLLCLNLTASAGFWLFGAAESDCIFQQGAALGEACYCVLQSPLYELEVWSIDWQKPACVVSNSLAATSHLMQQVDCLRILFDTQHQRVSTLTKQQCQHNGLLLAAADGLTHLSADASMTKI